MPTPKKKRVLHPTKTKTKPNLFWNWIASLGNKKQAKPTHPRTLVARRSLTKRTVGQKGHKKVDITIIGLGLVIAIIFGSSNIQNLFKASILSLNQKNAIVTSAKARLGIGYQLGGQGPSSYDCSGFTGAVIKEALGITLPRTSRDQYSVGQNIAFANLGVGDLVFFKTSGGDSISHVGIITNISGNDIKMTHANSYTGKVQEEDIKNSTYWQKTYYGAREITNATKEIVAPIVPDITKPVPPAIETKPDEYNNYFPPSELNDARIKVGAATIEQTTDSTKIINDTIIRTTPTATPSASASISPSPTPTTIATSVVPTPSASATVMVSPSPSPSIAPLASSTASTTPSPSISPSSTPKTATFADVSTSSKAYEAIEKLAAAGIINGYEDGTFRPNASVTRAELLKMIYKALDKPLATVKTSPFTDVTTKHALFSYIINAYNSGLVKGYGNKLFKPNQSVTRAEGSKMILKGFNITSEIKKTGFNDLDSKSDLTPYIAYLLSKDLLSAANNKAQPNMALTRADTAYIIANLID
jgi:cell wall-associated NlpC family hydrolase